MKETTIRLGGVPEHFNLPIHLAIEEGLFEAQGVHVEWTTFPGGTGQMTKALREGTVDACILLTEGIIQDIIRGNPSRIISEYVTTPLIWGIHTGFHNPLQRYAEAFTKKIAISRFGSGSHIMAVVDANAKGHKLAKSQFQVINDLSGALLSLEKLETDVFYWEKFMTKPHVDSGKLRRLGEFLTPWPCFVIAATDDAIKHKTQSLIRMLRVIHGRTDKFMEDDTAIKLVSKRYELKLADTERWYHSTAWATHSWVSDKMIKSVLFHLRNAGLIKKNEHIPEIIWKRE